MNDLATWVKTHVAFCFLLYHRIIIKFYVWKIYILRFFQKYNKVTNEGGILWILYYGEAYF